MVVKMAMQGDWIKEMSLPELEERAEIADRAFRAFRKMQTEHSMDAGEFAAFKLELRRRLDYLRNELDLHLADEHGIKIEGAAGVTVACFLKYGKCLTGKRVALIICGGNISDEHFDAVLSQDS